MNPDILNKDLGKALYPASSQTLGKQHGCYLSGPAGQDFVKVSLDVGVELLDGRFIIKEKIGVGKYCVVYKAYDKTLQDTVALKVGSFSPVGGSFIEQLLINEYKVNSFVKDKRHVLKIYEVNQCIYDGARLVLLSMEYADGGSLRDWLNNNGYEPGLRQSQGYAIFRQICLGLASLHDNNVCHLDLKPENILFVKGVAKIADFGISSLKYSAMHGYNNNTLDLLHYMGTARYMSPEQFIAPHIMSIDHRSDIYSAAVILFEMSHPQCETPFDGNDEFQRFQHLQTSVPEIETANNTVKRVLKRGLQKQPDDRYQSTVELIQDFDGQLEPPQETITEGNPEPSEIIQPVAPVQSYDQTVARLWDEAMMKIQEPDFDGAILLCRRIVGLDPNHTKAFAALQELESRFEKARQFYSTIKNGINTESLDHLVELLVEAVNIYPKHPDGHLVQTQLSSRSREFNEKMERRMELVRRDRQQRTANANRNRISNANTISNPTRRYNYSYVPSYRWYHRLWDSICDFFAG
jgi:hypothetical protein